MPRRKLPPIHPGEILLEEFLSPLGLSQYRLAIHLGAAILLLGAVAARHVMGISDGIMKTRGRWMEYRVGDRMEL